jgi:hypothetical protein
LTKIFRSRSSRAVSRRQLFVEPLEERILLSVDLVPYAPDNREEDLGAWTRNIEDDRKPGEEVSHSIKASVEARELVLLDTRAGSLKALIPGLSDLGFGDPDRS